MTAGLYESEALLRQYLDFHFRGDAPGYLPHHPLPDGVLGYPRRCAEWLIQHTTNLNRALDLGCAVGGGAFALSARFNEVVGVDFSAAFVDAAETIRREGVFRRSEDPWTLPSDARKERVRFLRGDACDLPSDLGRFDGVLMANLLCRLPDPAACLRGLRNHVAPGTVLIFTTPCSWDVAFTPWEKWLTPTLEALHAHLDPWCELLETREMSFVIREHERKAQFTVAEGSAWRVKSGM